MQNTMLKTYTRKTFLLNLQHKKIQHNQCSPITKQMTLMNQWVNQKHAVQCKQCGPSDSQTYDSFETFLLIESKTHSATNSFLHHRFPDKLLLMKQIFEWIRMKSNYWIKTIKHSQCIPKFLWANSFQWIKNVQCKQFQVNRSKWFL